MQQRKFYGRTLRAIMAQVRRELGVDALILDTREVEPGGVEARAYPGARFVVLAASDPYDEPRVKPATHAAPSARYAAASSQGRLASQEEELPEPKGVAERLAARRLAQVRQSGAGLAGSAGPAAASSSPAQLASGLAAILAAQAKGGQPGGERPAERLAGSKESADAGLAGRVARGQTEPVSSGRGAVAREPVEPGSVRRSSAIFPASRAFTVAASDEERAAATAQPQHGDHAGELSVVPAAAPRKRQDDLRTSDNDRERKPLPDFSPERDSAAPRASRSARAGLRPLRGASVLEDLGLLRAQINDLLEGGPAEAVEVDLGDYHELIDLGVDHAVLAPHFRRWLRWRTSDESIRRYIVRHHGGPATRMQGESLREWLWLAWSEGQGLLADPDAPAAGAEQDDGPTLRIDQDYACPGRSRQPRMVALVGPTGSGKTTSLAKLSSISCRDKRQNAVIVTLDTFRFGATEQWRRMSRLMDLPVAEIVSQADLSKFMETVDQWTWVGIDTPGNLDPDSEPGRLYGSILAQCPFLETLLVLPATQHESVSREQMKRAQTLGAQRVLVSKLDETERTGGIVNLTMDGQWKIDSFATGPVVPRDWEAASHEALWRRVLAPRTATPALLGGVQ